MMNWIGRAIAVGMVALGVLIAAVSTSAEPSPAARAFERLTGLVGTWKGVQEGTEFKVTYTLAANGSVLIEEFRPKSGSMMVTMFTVDVDRLMAMHYCSAGNQPQMATAVITDPTQKLVFSLVRVTGRRAPTEWHNTGLVVTVVDTDHVMQEWTYEHNGSSGKNVFHFARVR
jgi:hypothetical protein